MNAILNYMLEANAGLLIILACYRIFLTRETDFTLMRIFLLTGILSCLVFPLIHVKSATPIAGLSVGQMIPSYWLPEVVVGGNGAQQIPATAFGLWDYTAIVYLAGLVIGGLVFLFQLSRLFSVMWHAKPYPLGRLRIAESPDDKPTFSFFNFIFIGKAHTLSGMEKQQIILHESIHARQRHSFDVLLMNVLKIFFWFNPFIYIYKKIFIHLHEFEADARAVEQTDVNKYCSLLAKVALQSADFTLASHFNHSLTVKRIEMIRTIKSAIKRWKVAALVAAIPVMFFFIACQDQVSEDIVDITRNSSHALATPDFIQQRLTTLKKENPGKNYAVLMLNETASEKLDEMKKTYGLPSSVEVFTASDGKVIEQGIKARASDLVIESNKAGASNGDVQTFAIVEFNAEVSRAADAAAPDKIFTVVEEPPEFPGGYNAMMEFIRSNLQYPASARQKGIEGTVFLSFIVETNGSVSDVHVIRGIGPEADAEAVRVLQLSPNWIPGKQHKQVVRVRFVIPIKFKLKQESPSPK